MIDFLYHIQNCVALQTDLSFSSIPIKNVITELILCKNALNIPFIDQAKKIRWLDLKVLYFYFSLLLTLGSICCRHLCHFYIFMMSRKDVLCNLNCWKACKTTTATSVTTLKHPYCHYVAFSLSEEYLQLDIYISLRHILFHRIHYMGTKYGCGVNMSKIIDSKLQSLLTYILELKLLLSRITIKIPKNQCKCIRVGRYWHRIWF